MKRSLSATANKNDNAATNAKECSPLRPPSKRVRFALPVDNALNEQKHGLLTTNSQHKLKADHNPEPETDREAGFEPKANHEPTPETDYEAGPTGTKTGLSDLDEGDTSATEVYSDCENEANTDDGDYNSSDDDDDNEYRKPGTLSKPTGEEFDVACIERHVDVGSTRWFRIRWKGYSRRHNTWERACFIPHAALVLYEGARACDLAAARALVL